MFVRGGVAQITLFEFVNRNYFSQARSATNRSGRTGNATVECDLDPPSRVGEISKAVVMDLLSSGRIDHKSMMPRHLALFQPDDCDLPRWAP